MSMAMSQADFVNKNRQMAYKSQFANHCSRSKKKHLREPSHGVYQQVQKLFMWERHQSWRLRGQEVWSLSSTEKHGALFGNITSRGRLESAQKLSCSRTQGYLPDWDFLLNQRVQGRENEIAFGHTWSLALNVKNLGNSFCKKKSIQKAIKSSKTLEYLYACF